MLAGRPVGDGFSADRHGIRHARAVEPNDAPGRAQRYTQDVAWNDTLAMLVGGGLNRLRRGGAPPREMIAGDERHRDHGAGSRE